MTSTPRLSIALLILGLGVSWEVAPLVAQNLSPPVSEPEPSRTVLQRFLSHEVVPLASYRAVRRLRAENRRFNADGWLEVETTLSNGTLVWRVVAEDGTGYIRNKVLRKALTAEAEMLANGQSARGALTPDNYEFVAGADGWIGLRPRRQDTLLVTGSALVSEADGDLLEVHGRLTKNPSFWTRNVDVRRRYARINGVRVPIAMESTAHVRLAGQSRFEMTYRYLEVNGTAVDGQAHVTRSIGQ